MFEAIVTLCVELHRVIKERRLGQRAVFVDHIDPIFQQLILVHEDYTAGICAIVKLMEDFTVDPETLYQATIDKKLKLDHLRQLVIDLNMAALFSNEIPRPVIFPVVPRNRKEAIFQFAEAVLGYFQLSVGSFGDGYGSTCFTALADLVEALVDGRVDRYRILDAANDILHELPQRWSSISTAYAHAKAFCLKAK